MRTVRNIRPIYLFAVILAATSLTGCEYWWTRGQPPAVQTLITRAKGHLDDAREIRKKEPQSVRSEVVASSQVIEESLLQAVASIEKGQSPQSVVDGLQKAQTAFVTLEGKMSVGSRAAYGELSGQLRGFVGAAGKGQPLQYPAVGLFTARTLSFLARELALPSNA